MGFGDKEPVAAARSSAALGPNTQYEAACNVWGEILGDILQELERLEGDLLDMRQESQELEKSGMYPAIPSESWQPRNGKGSYLWMIFPRGTSDMPRMLYIGNKPEAVTKARQFAARRRRWEELDRAIKEVRYFLNGIRVELAGIARRVERVRY